MRWGSLGSSRRGPWVAACVRFLRFLCYQTSTIMKSHIHYWRQVSETGHLWSDIDGIYVPRPPRPHICFFLSFKLKTVCLNVSLCVRVIMAIEISWPHYLDVFTMRSSLPRRFCDHSARHSMRHEHRTFRVVLDTDAGGDISLIQRTHTSTFQLFISGV